MKKLNVLILDDEKRVRDEISEYLTKLDLVTLVAEKPSEAFDILDRSEVDIMVLDIKLPEMNGLEVLNLVKQKHPGIEVIMISGHGDMQSVIEALRNNATDYFQKPFRLSDLHAAIHRTERFIRLNNQLQAYSRSVSVLTDKLYESIGTPLIGQSDEVKKLISLMEKVAQTDHTSVLITGESGTGKELVAHGIHLMSSRSSQMFHSVNCSAITDTLFESEFFGHKKGAFTGAMEERQGWFEIAEKGTIFLDEISDMPMTQQAKLLRVLEQRQLSKVGSHQTIDVDVRVIAASNQELERMAASKQFRPDLYHRLSTFTIHIPPLRERKDDIPLLLEHFTLDFSKKMKKKINKIDKVVTETLLGYDFPGNVRELRNMVERAVILCDGNTLLPIHFNQLSVISKNKACMREDPWQIDQEECYDLTTLEMNLIEKAMEKAAQNKVKAAELLNISWQALNRRMRKYGLE